MMKNGLFRVALVAALTIAVMSAHGAAVAAQGDCAQPASAGSSPTATDALFILNAAVGLVACALCVCDVDGSGAITASDALSGLRLAVGGMVELRCPPCGDTTTTTTTTTTVPPGEQPVLVAGDFPSVFPCSNRDTLPNDATFLATITNAAVVDNHVHFTQYDTDGLPEICGLTDIDNTLDQSNVDWDPGVDNIIHVCNELLATVNEFFTHTSLGHGPDLCQTGNNTFTLAMPRAGTYRRDACIESGSDAYDVRTRMTVSGASVDQTLTSLGIDRSDLMVCNGATQLVTREAAKTFLAANPGNFTFTINSGGCSGGVEHLSVTGEIICVKDRTSACPPHDVPCS
jgi:hypothetical protein